MHLDPVEPPTTVTAPLDLVMDIEDTADDGDDDNSCPPLDQQNAAISLALNMQLLICSFFVCILPETFTLKCIGLCTPQY